MTEFFVGDTVDAVVRGLLGGIDVDDGPTAEQLAILSVMAKVVWKRPDLDLAVLNPNSLTPLSAQDVAAVVTDPAARKRYIGLLVILEMCRHPVSADQVARVEECAAAMDTTGDSLTVIRTWIDKGAAQASEDMMRYFREWDEIRDEPRFRDRGVAPTDLDPDLVEQLKALGELPEGTLGRMYFEFDRSHNFPIPGSVPESVFSNGTYVQHDMNHVIADYPPTGEGEIALGAFEFMMNDSEATWIRFLSSLAIHEAGMSRLDGFDPKQSTLSRPGAIEMLGEALERGAECSSDFSMADHMAMADWPIEKVREFYNVLPLSSAQGDS